MIFLKVSYEGMSKDSCDFPDAEDVPLLCSDVVFFDLNSNGCVRVFCERDYARNEPCRVKRSETRADSVHDWFYVCK